MNGRDSFTVPRRVSTQSNGFTHVSPCERPGNPWQTGRRCAIDSIHSRKPDHNVVPSSRNTALRFAMQNAIQTFSPSLLCLGVNTLECTPSPAALLTFSACSRCGQLRRRNDAPDHAYSIVRESALRRERTCNDYSCCQFRE